jgi:hypothetical protein
MGKVPNCSCGVGAVCVNRAIATGRFGEDDSLTCGASSRGWGVAGQTRVLALCARRGNMGATLHVGPMAGIVTPGFRSKTECIDSICVPRSIFHTYVDVTSVIYQKTMQ